MNSVFWVAGIIFVFFGSEFMCRKMPYRIFTFLSLFILSLLFINAHFHEGSFETVLNQARNEAVRGQLQAFRKGGIEKPVTIQNYVQDSVIEFAKSYLGTPHVMGGTTRKGIDCSGLVKVVHKKFGITLPHNCQEQARFGKIVAIRDSLKKGDLVFFYRSFQCRDFITHSGIYVGDGNFIHTSSSKGVIISKLQDQGYWEERYLFGTRLSGEVSNFVESDSVRIGE